MDVNPTPPVEGQPQLTRAKGLWFEDCGLIIQAETTIFRVSSAILSIQSTVFRDMFSLPTPKDTDTMDGCPFVLLPDTAKDITAFLRAIFYYDFFEPFPATTTFPVLSSVLRMSHKYEVDVLRKRALAHLSHAHPTTLDDWDLLQGALPSWIQEHAKEDKDLLLAGIARQVGADWILPAVFYRICQTSFEDTVIAGGYLSNVDKVNWVKGLRYLVTTGAADVLEFLWAIYDCSDADAHGCSASMKLMRRDMEKRRNYDPDKSNPMPLELFLDIHWSRLDLCNLSAPSAKAAHKDARQKLWETLPKVFGLSKWTELEKMKVEALK